MRVSLILLATILAVSPPSRLAAQATPLPASGEKFTFHSTVLGEDREVWVHLPTGGRSGERFDVVYTLDADATFPLASTEVGFRTMMGIPPRMVIVGITSVNTRGRGRDFTQVVDTSRREWFPETGQADRFLRFLEAELIPHIAAQYPVTTHRILIGHSLAGLFALHAFAARPALFEGYIAISPTIPWGREAILATLETRLRDVTAGRALYVSVGDEAEGYQEGITRLESLFRQRAPAALRWKVERFPDESHTTTVPPAVHRGLAFVTGPAR